MPADRLTVLDDAFLALDTPDAPLHVGWTIKIDGRAPSVGGLRRHLLSRMDRVPRFRRRLVGTTFAGGELRWEDDQGFDIARHVMGVNAAAAGDGEALRELAGRLLSTALPLDRPLWRIYLVDGLDDGFAVVGQAHHALIDGIAAIEVAALLFDAEPNPRPEPRSVWRPERTGNAHAALSLTRDRFRLGAGKGAAVARAGRQTATRTKALILRPSAPPIPRLEPPAEAARTVSALTDILRSPASTPMASTAGPAREIGLSVLELESIRRIARQHEATVNDVILACVGHALGQALQRRDEIPVPLKAMMPVNVRTGSAQDLGNALSFVFVDLPSDRDDPHLGLQEVVERTRRVKQGDYAATLTGIVRLADLVPTAGRRAASKVVASAARFDLTVSNVPGPDIPLYLLGRRVRALFPAVPMWSGHGLTVGALSYYGNIHVCVYADRGVVSDATQIADDIALAAHRLDTQDVPPTPPSPMHRDVTATATPWGRRARVRRERVRAST
ncbi:MAG: wax ester/triacylglycerol synthase family O-acyltransferase [Solirubrobacteraceae bacterium]